MSSNEWNKFSPEDIKVCLLSLSDNFLNYTGNVFSKKECKIVSDIILYYAGICDKWLEISGYDNSIFSRKKITKKPIGEIKIRLKRKLGISDFIKVIIPVLVSGNVITVSDNILNEKKIKELYKLFYKSNIPQGTINISGELDNLSFEGNQQEIPGNIEKYTISKEILY